MTEDLIPLMTGQPPCGALQSRQPFVYKFPDAGAAIA